MSAAACPDCDHPAHPDESCAYIPWDGNPYGLECNCPPDAERRAEDEGTDDELVAAMGRLEQTLRATRDQG